jgi:hypothetical protein
LAGEFKKGKRMKIIAALAERWLREAEQLELEAITTAEADELLAMQMKSDAARRRAVSIELEIAIIDEQIEAYRRAHENCLAESN